MDEIIILHTQNKSPLASPAPVWKTCLRQISVVSPSEVHKLDVPIDIANLDDKKFEVLRGERGLQFLMEVLCGLHSPVVGETEVFGQFKIFSEKLQKQGDNLYHHSAPWLKFVLKEVKELRSKHLMGIGSHSYGSLLRRRTKGQGTVSIFGSGHLAQEIIPWFEGKKVQLICRDLAKAKEMLSRLPQGACPEIELVRYTDIFEGKVSVVGESAVIAAPLQDNDIERLLSGSAVRPFVFDLRGESNQIKQLYADCIDLQDLFAELSHLRKDLEDKIKFVRLQISEKVEQFSLRAECRPMGWDDLCA